MSACPGLHTKIVTLHRNKRVAAGHSVSHAAHLGSGTKGPVISGGLGGGCAPSSAPIEHASPLCSPIPLGTFPIHCLLAAPPLSFSIAADDEAFHQGRRASQHFGVSASSFWPLHLSPFLFIFLFILVLMVGATAGAGAATNKFGAHVAYIRQLCLIHLLSLCWG